MGTHPIFESDFDCLTEKMSVSIDELWATILQDKNSVGTSALKNRRVVIVGDSLSGRKTLIAKLISEEKETFRGHGLGYDYLTVNHNDEDYGCLSLFSIDPSAPLRAQLKAALPDKKSLSEAIVVIAVDLARPWAVINSLQKWIKEISAHKTEWLQLDGTERGEMCDRLQEKWMKAAQCEELNDITLTENLGIEVIVAALKSDIHQSTLNDEGMTEQHADLLQYNLRMQCLQIGAALFYCSVKDARTLDTLRAYILHHLFGIETDLLTARGVSREALFLPIGWDTEKRIGLLREGTELPEEIVQPKQRSIVTEQELTAEDEQQALVRVEQLLEQTGTRGPSTGVAQPKSRLGSSPSVPAQQLPRPTVGGSPATGPATPGGPRSMTPGGGQVANERMLADFFNQLLLKKGPAGSTPKQGAPGGTTPKS